LPFSSKSRVRLDQWFLTCGEWRSCQVGNDWSDSRTTASKYLRTKHFMG